MTIMDMTYDQLSREHLFSDRDDDWEHEPVVEDRYEDYPSTVMLSRRVQMAAKDHGKCFNCGEDIKKGQKYERIVYLLDTEFRVDRIHDEYCWERVEE